MIKQLPNLGEKNKERPLCYLYSIKARAIIHAHLSRIPLNQKTLELDRQYIIRKCPYLIYEQVSCVNQLIMLAYARRIMKLPRLQTIENCMKLCPMIVQALWEFKSPLLQLPYIGDDNLKYFNSKKRQIKSLEQFAQLKADERRNMLRDLGDDEYENIMKSIVDIVVMDDENPKEVTAKAIVTVTVTLTRKDMSTLFGDETAKIATRINENGTEDTKESGAGEPANEAAANKRPAWLKQQKKVDESPNPAGDKKKEKSSKREEKEDEDSDSEEDSVAGSDVEEDKSSDEDDRKSNPEDDDQEWEKFQKIHEREKSLEGKSKSSHPVHCPYFPHDKQEYWWVYICDRRSRTLLTHPYHVTSLVEKEAIHLKFTAPKWPGIYTFTVCLRSDSYLGFDQQKDIKLDVKEPPPEVTEHPQWEFEDSEEEA
ncbi:unnamed protein product, partial [Acanthoscelides obtectus]